MIFYHLWIIIKYKTIELFRTDIRCWFGHKYQDTDDINIKKCKRCGQSTLFINAIYED